jgi:hypothetical protein
VKLKIDQGPSKDKKIKKIKKNNNNNSLPKTSETFRCTLYDLLSSSAYSWTMKMEEVCSFETSVDFQRTTRRYIPENCIIIVQSTQKQKHLHNFSYTLKKTPWPPQPASELYRPSDRRVSAKLMPTFCGQRVPRGQRDESLRPYSRLSRPKPLLLLPSSSSVVLTRLSGSPSRPTLFFLAVPGNRTQNLRICSQDL